MTVLAFLLVATSVFAQGRRAGAGMEMLKELDLTTEQQDKIKTIRKDTRTKMEALRGEDGKRGENRDAFRSLREESKAAVLEVLTPAQRAQLEAQKEARKEARKNIDREGMRAELKAYREKEIEPVLRASRGQLDQYISAEDRQEIDRLRAVFETRPKRKGKEAPRKGASKEDRAEAHKAGREAGKAWREEHATDVESLKTLTEKYSVELERVQSVLANRRTTWRQEMAEIKGKYLPEGTPDRRGDKARKGKKGKGQDANRGGKPGRGDRMNQMKASAFLLLKS